MKEHEIPLNNAEIRMIPLRSFYFDPNKLDYVVGNTTTQISVKLSEIKDFSDIYYKSDKVVADIGYDNSEMLLLSNCDTLVETPSLRKWIDDLSDQEKDNVSRRAELSIVNVLKYYNPRVKIPNTSHHTSSLFSVAVNIFENGVFSIGTVGNYSTLQRSNHQGAYSSFLYRDKMLEEVEKVDTSLPTEYALHNSDYFPSQTLSLFAGAGTIAWLAKNCGTLHKNAV